MLNSGRKKTGSALAALLSATFYLSLISIFHTTRAKDVAGTRPPLSAELVEQSIEPLRLTNGGDPVPMSLQKLMELNKVPGISVAVIDNFKIAWAKGYGVVAPDGNAPVNPRTLFLAGSVSKSVTAVGMTALVERNRLSLDEDVNQRLKTWRVPENAFTQNEKVTLRRIASHTAGLTVFGFAGYSISDKVPTLLQILDGLPPANSPPVRVESIPGSSYSYSGGGTTVEQLVMMDVMKQSFPILMKEVVFDKLAMHDSTFEQNLPRTWKARVSSGTEADGRLVAGRWHVYPEMAAAGLWTTPTDLAKLAIEVALSANGRSNKLAAPPLARDQISAQPATDGTATLGFFLDPSSANTFVNNGSDRGFKAMLRMDGQTGQGAIIMTNADNGFLVATEYMHAIATVYRWSAMPPGRVGGRLLVLIAKAKGVDAALGAFEELKRSASESERPDEYAITLLGDRLFDSGDTQGAIRVMERAASEYPNSAAIYADLGKMYADTAQQEPAILAYQRALVLDSSMSDVKHELDKLKPN